MRNISSGRRQTVSSPASRRRTHPCFPRCRTAGHRNNWRIPFGLSAPGGFPSFPLHGRPCHGVREKNGFLQYRRFELLQAVPGAPDGKALPLAGEVELHRDGELHRPGVTVFSAERPDIAQGYLFRTAASRMASEVFHPSFSSRNSLKGSSFFAGAKWSTSSTQKSSVFVFMRIFTHQSGEPLQVHLSEKLFDFSSRHSVSPEKKPSLPVQVDPDRSAAFVLQFHLDGGESSKVRKENTASSVSALPAALSCSSSSGRGPADGASGPEITMN